MLCARSIYRHKRAYRCIKINTPACEACVHAMPCVCTVTEEVSLNKGQRAQRFLREDQLLCRDSEKSKVHFMEDRESNSGCLSFCQHSVHVSFTVWGESDSFVRVCRKCGQEEQQESLKAWRKLGIFRWHDTGLFKYAPNTTIKL